MNAHADFGGGDPRRSISLDDLKLASLQAAPRVAPPAKGGDRLGLALGALGALALGALTLGVLAHDRNAAGQAKSAAPVPLAPLSGPVTVARVPAPAMIAAAAVAAPATAAAAGLDPNQQRAGPMIIDNTSGGLGAADRPTGAAPAAAPGTAGAASGSTLLTGEEQFSQRVAGDGGSAHAIGLSDPTSTVMQGTIIAAVLETALNSDLPGYVRAIVSRDVRGFDGTRVMIPRGSRLIGQYKSGLSAGQTRAFIVWTRLIRPDGASIPLGSPVMDETGQTGVSGRVNRHFVQRFGSAILLSVVGGLAGAMSDSSSSTLVIGTGSEAASAASQALQTDGRIPPTIRIPQGAPIQVFTARDLDFSGL